MNRVVRTFLPHKLAMTIVCLRARPSAQKLYYSLSRFHFPIRRNTCAHWIDTPFGGGCYVVRTSTLSEMAQRECRELPINNARIL